MLRPQDTATREKKNLDGLWSFALDPEGEGRDAGWYRGPLPGSRLMAVPTSFNDLVTDPAVREYFGDIWYQTTVRVPRGWDDQRIVLNLESATHRAVVWGGNTRVAEHEGGYTPFEAEVTDVVTPGEEVRVTVGVNNVAVVLLDADGVVTATGTGASGTLTVADVHRWAPGEGYLYDLEARLLDDGVPVDSYHLKVGIRTVEVRGTEFLVNGAPFHFTGFGMHEDHPVIGKAHNNAHLVHDFELLHWIGANSFRTSHYPYSEDVLEYADREGVVVIDETAAVGLNMGLGGRIFGGQGYETFSAETVNETTQEVHAQAIRELIARDKNHPSVVLWSIANEPESQTEAAENYFRPLFETFCQHELRSVRLCRRRAPCGGEPG